MLKLDPGRQARKFLDQVPLKHARQLAAKLLQLRQNPYPSDAKQLKGEPYWSASAGEYRIIYRVEGDTLRIAVVGKHNDDDVYRQLRRLT